MTRITPGQLKQISSADVLPDTVGRTVRLTKVGGVVWLRTVAYALPLSLVETILFRPTGDCHITLLNGRIIYLSSQEADYLKGYFGG